MDARVHIYIATALGRGRVADPMFGRLYPGESPGYSFYMASRVQSRYVKEPHAEIRASEQNLSDFSRSMLEESLMS